MTQRQRELEKEVEPYVLALLDNTSANQGEWPQIWDCGEVNYTGLEEECQDALIIDPEEWDNNDLSFFMSEVVDRWWSSDEQQEA